MKRIATVLFLLLIFFPVQGIPQDVPNVQLFPPSEAYPGTAGVNASPLPQDPIFFIRLEGESQGLITEGITFPGVVNMSGGLSFHDGIVIPTDPQSGQPTGQRVHKPLTVIKLWDLASPKIFFALCSGERIKTASFHFVETDRDGSVTAKLQTIELHDAVVVGNRTFTDGTRLLEEVSFTYRKIIVTHHPSGNTAEDDWRVPKGGR